MAREITMDDVAPFLDGKWHRWKEMDSIAQRVIGPFTYYGLTHNKIHNPKAHVDALTKVTHAILAVTEPLGFDTMMTRQPYASEDTYLDEVPLMFKLTKGKEA